MLHTVARHAAALGAIVLSAAVGACGSSSSTGSSSSARPAATTTSASNPRPAIADLGAAEHPRAADFPRVGGRSLRQLASAAKASAQLGPATGTFTPGTRRLAFALTTSSGGFIYAPTAIYLAKNADSPALGPFLAPADPMTVAPAYQSKQNSGPGGIQAIYATTFPIGRPGTYTVLALTRTSAGLIGSPGEIAVAASSPIPDVGQRAPALATDTLASTHGNLALLTTRIPPENMHAVSFDQVLGKRPVALLFSTPQLCTSRVCGPVTDIAAELQPQFAGKITFLHQEVYVDNQPSKGLRPQLKAFHLQTEPWLFTVNAHGVIAARLEGAFGVNEFRKALLAALR